MRIRLLQRIIFGGLLVVWTGLFLTQVVHGRRYRDQSEKNRTRLIHLPAARGAILDRHGVPLAEDRINFELAAFPQELISPQLTWERLDTILGIPPEEFAKRYRKGFQARFSPVTLVQDLPQEVAFRLEEERAQLPGILVRPVPHRTYPLGPSVGAVVGYLGLIAPEELTRLRPYGYTFRDRVGKDGLEQVYDSFLRGHDGGRHLEVNAQGRLVQQLGYLPPERGRRIKVSIDARLQEVCHRLLEGGRGAVVVMDCASGEILCLESSPSFDPNSFGDPDRQEEVRSILHDPDRPMFNRVTRAVVPPGSIFKAAVAYEALKTGKISPQSTFECRGRFELGRSIFDCWAPEGHSTQTVVDALEHSCNVFFYNTGRRLGVEGIAQAARAFRLNEPTGIDLPRESKGLVPDPEWMRKTRRHEWQEGDTISFAIGQSALQVTPLEMLMLFTAIAEEGAAPHPHLLLGIEELSGWSMTDSREKGIRIQMDHAALATVRHGLEQVVSSDTGTGRLAQLPGIQVAGKTGTAQVSEGLPHAWFCGYAPAAAPKISFVVFLEHGGKGGLQAARVAGQLLVHLKEMGYL